ncbi:MAG: hypothetical protein ACOCRK_07035 [bacterium]
MYWKPCFIPPKNKIKWNFIKKIYKKSQTIINNIFILARSNL